MAINSSANPIPRVHVAPPITSGPEGFGFLRLIITMTHTPESGGATLRKSATSETTTKNSAFGTQFGSIRREPTSPFGAQQT